MLPYSFLFVWPLVFLGTFGFLWSSRWFGLIALAVAVLAVLDAWWFVDSWAIAYDYDGGRITLTLQR
jgi:hypothetical protein